MNSFDYSGYWWLPGNEENKHFGNLSFSHNEGLTLEMFGSFSLDALEPGESVSLGDIKQYPVIKGITRGGKYLTLFDCDSAGLVLSAPGFASKKFTIGYAFEETTPNTKRSPSSTFYKAFLQYTYLPDWVGSSGIQENLFLNNETGKLDRLEVTYRTPDEVVANLEKAKISIVEGYNFSSRNRLTHGVSLQPIISFEIEVVDEMALEDWFTQYIEPLRDFLTLATRRPNAVTRLSLYSNQNRAEASGSTLETSATTIYYRQPVARRAREEKAVDIYNMLFGFHDISVEFEQVLNTWLSKRDKFRSTMNLFFAVENTSGTSLNNEFLNLVQALEVYHRQRFNSTIIPGSDYREKKEEIVESVPGEYRTWLTEQLAYGNQPRLFQRLLELSKHTEKVTSKLVTNSENFARKVTDTRNFLTHYSRRSKNVMDDEELFRATQSLSYMIQACLMLELGLSEERIVKLFERNQRFLFTASQIRQAHYWDS